MHPPIEIKIGINENNFQIILGFEKITLIINPKIQKTGHWYSNHGLNAILPINPL